MNLKILDFKNAGMKPEYRMPYESWAMNDLTNG